MTKGTAKDVAAVVGSAGEIVGRTRLQKTLALLEMTGTGYGYPFQYYKFGPYSEDLVVSLDRAVALGYVEEEERKAAWGGRYSIFRAANNKLTGNPARDTLIELARDADSIALELAVTAAFLAKEGVQDAWREVATRKPEKSGSDHLKKARELYSVLSKVDGVPRKLPQLA